MSAASATGELRLRPASLADLELLRGWDSQPHVVAGKGDEDWEWEAELARNPPWREQLIAELDGRPIGFLEIIDPALEETRYWGDVEPGQQALDIWIGEPDRLGQGYGTRMMIMAIERCFADESITGILVDPLAGNTGAHRFYQRLGFRFIEYRKFDGEDCHVYHLAREEFVTPGATTHHRP